MQIDWKSVKALGWALLLLAVDTLWRVLRKPRWGRRIVWWLYLKHQEAERATGYPVWLEGAEEKAKELGINI